VGGRDSSESEERMHIGGRDRQLFIHALIILLNYLRMHPHMIRCFYQEPACMMEPNAPICPYIYDGRHTARSFMDDEHASQDRRIISGKTSIVVLGDGHLPQEHKQHVHCFLCIAICCCCCSSSNSSSISTHSSHGNVWY
jgi:hypothetical protein